MPETISQKIERFYSLIRDYQEGAHDTRYKSWEWCHKAFLENKDNVKEDNIEFLSLHLAFYLASWGMYRGSSYLLKRDYKAHKAAVREIIRPEYSSLWNYIPSVDNIESTNKLLFSVENGLYWKIKKSYKGLEDETEADESSDTLTTKILMGTFGCVPAFDRFLKSGIKCYQDNHDGRRTYIGNYKLSQSIEKSDGTSATDSFKVLAKFAIEHSNELNVDADFYYPPMKCVDMYFWEIGYEMDIATLLEKENTNENIKQRLYNKAVELNYCENGITYDEAISQIKRLNYDE